MGSLRGTQAKSKATPKINSPGKSHQGSAAGASTKPDGPKSGAKGGAGNKSKGGKGCHPVARVLLDECHQLRGEADALREKLEEYESERLAMREEIIRSLQHADSGAGVGFDLSTVTDPVTTTMSTSVTSTTTTTSVTQDSPPATADPDSTAEEPKSNGSTAELIEEELRLRRLKRELLGDTNKYGDGPLSSPGGPLFTPGKGGGGGGTIFMLANRTLMNNPKIMICQIPKTDYRFVVPPNLADYGGLAERFVSWWRDEDYPLLRDVWYVGIVVSRDLVADTRPFEDADEVFRDGYVYTIQPAIQYTLHDGSEFVSVTSKWPGPWLEQFTLGRWFPPSPNDFISQPPHLRFPLETVPVPDGLIADGSASYRDVLADFMIGECAVKMQQYIVSGYALQNFYQRRTLLTPSLDKSLTVKRMVRMYSEDPLVNSYLDVKFANGRSVQTDTINFLMTLALGELDAPIQSF
jgi:hypothetical protein